MSYAKTKNRYQLCNHHIWKEESIKVMMGPICRQKNEQRIKDRRYARDIEYAKRLLRLRYNLEV